MLVGISIKNEIWTEKILKLFNWKKIVEWWEKLQQLDGGGHIRCSSEVKGGIRGVREWRKIKTYFIRIHSAMQYANSLCMQAEHKIWIDLWKLLHIHSSHRALKGFETYWRAFMNISFYFDTRHFGHFPIKPIKHWYVCYLALFDLYLLVWWFYPTK